MGLMAYSIPLLLQDKGEHPSVHKVVEPSEEIRLGLCRLLHTLVQALLNRNAGAVIHPYFHETILFFQAQLHDPFPVRGRMHGWGPISRTSCVDLWFSSTCIHHVSCCFASLQELKVEACQSLCLLAGGPVYEVSALLDYHPLVYQHCYLSLAAMVRLRSRRLTDCVGRNHTTYVRSLV